MKDKKIVYFVRHGQSKDNVAPVFQSTDSPLSPAGVGQAKKIASRVSKLKIDALISSPLPRTKETAQIIAQATGLKPEYSELLVERKKPSSINGKPHTDSAASKLWREWEASLYAPGAKIQDGENYDEIVARTNQALKMIENRPEESILVVTHGFFLRAIVANILLGNHLNGETFKSIQRIAWMENTGITVLRLAEGFEEGFAWRLWIYNDIAHLAD